MEPVGDSISNQWSRVKKGEPLQLNQSSNKVKEFSGGLVIIGMAQLQKEQLERQEASFMETNLISESGLDTDEFIFLEEQEEKKFLFREQQRQEMEDFKESVKGKVYKPETSYLEDLYKAKKKKKLAEINQKKRNENPLLGLAQGRQPRNKKWKKY